MLSALIVHSKHTEDYARVLSRKYKDAEFLEVIAPPTKETLNIKNDKDIVIGIGGGSVIDTAKIISEEKRCIAIPTTAAGACMTPYATIWGKEKESVPTKKPIVRMDYSMQKNLPVKVLQSTAFDALSHAIESFWSKNSIPESRNCSIRAIRIIDKYVLKKINNPLGNKEVNKLIYAGNLAGKAIAIAETNVIHAASYPITLEYGIDHGSACGLLLPYFVGYIDFKGLPKLFNFNSNEKLARLLEKSFIPPKIENFDARLIAKRAMKYEKIKQGPKKIGLEDLEKILRNAGERGR